MKTANTIIQGFEPCDSAVDWLGRKGVRSAWNTCDRADWMLWALERLVIDRKTLVRIACDIAEPTLKFLPAGEDRPRIAIATARSWCDGVATPEDVANAAANAYAAYLNYATYDAYAANSAANSAAGAAFTAFTVTYATYVVNAAANSATYAGHTPAKRQCADIVRKYVSAEDVEALIEKENNHA